MNGSKKDKLRVLMHNRSNVFTQRGGDTVVMERVAERLKELGMVVDYDLNATKSSEDYDIAHIFNFATPDITEAFARRCVETGIPYVVTTMYEDWPLFYNQTGLLYRALEAYINAGQPRDKWTELLDAVRNVEPCAKADNTYAALNAEALIATGVNEAEALRRDYPDAKAVEIYRVGCDLENSANGVDAFTRETGLSDFILCVGRLETRKNQLMLLKAFEDSDATLVFATGGFTYQPEYEELCRKFQRRGKTVFLDKLEPAMLATAFRAAKVHVLPSWYELPGIVSVEAARSGANIVVSDYGTARDYFKDLAYYCTPDDAEDIYRATVEAFMAPKKPELKDRAFEYTWSKAGDRTLEIYQQVLNARKGLPSPRQNSTSSQKTTSSTKSLRILMQARPNALTERGGDTTVMEELTKGLKGLGVHVDVDLSGTQDLESYDLVHLYNFAIREVAEALARRCVQANKPYVITPMYEDWPLFWNQMTAHCQALKIYVDNGQKPEHWVQLSHAARNVEISPIWDNSFTANHAGAIIPTGEYEAAILRRDYPQAKLIEIYYCGCEISDFSDGGELFRKETGIDDFILCVGRPEWRKNQLMLLKALEDSELTLVFATGGLTFQPEYDELCRNFKRAGKTVFLGRLERDVLASGFQAARVHALPSWFELPGLVSLEAARYGTNVVVTDYGTARDYFGDLAYYCKPDDPESIYNAVMAGYYAPSKQGLSERISEFTWQGAVERNLEIYEKVLGIKHASEPVYSVAKETLESATINASNAADSVGQISEVFVADDEDEARTQSAEEICNKGDEFVKRGETDLAISEYERALSIDPYCVRASRSRAVALLAVGRYTEAERYCEEALKIEPLDARTLTCLGAVKWELGEQEEAFRYYMKSAQVDANDLSTVLYLVNASHVLGKLPELEAVLRRCLAGNRDNMEIQYCLAGCYYCQAKYGKAMGVLEHILQCDSGNEKALELKNKIEELEDREVTPESGDLFDLAELTPALKLKTLQEAKRRKDYDFVIEKAFEVENSADSSESQKVLASILKGECLGCKGELEAAEEEFKRTESNTSFGYRALAGRGAVAASLENWDDAEAFFTRALTMNPNHDVAMAGLGLCASQKGSEEKAWEHFAAALDKNPENLRALVGIVDLGYSIGRLTDIEKFLEAYLEMNPADLSILYSYAGCLYQQGRAEEAGEELDKILLFDPAHEMARELLEKIRGGEATETAKSL